MKISAYLILIFISVQAYSQITIDAGNPIKICNTDLSAETITIGGEPTVSGEYKKLAWEFNFNTPVNHYCASDFLDDTTSLNPRLITKPSVGIFRFYLHVTDFDDNKYIDSATIIISELVCLDNGYSIEKGDSVIIGSDCIPVFEPYTCNWITDYNLNEDNDISALVWPEHDTIYKCIMTDSVGCQFNGSAYVSVNALGVDLTKNNDIYVYPNPVTPESLLFLGTDNLLKEIRIIDSKGAQAVFLRTERNSLKVSDYITKPGVYLYQVKTPNSKEIQGKFIYTR